jgi:hypothetical protein
MATLEVRATRNRANALANFLQIRGAREITMYDDKVARPTMLTCCRAPDMTEMTDETAEATVTEIEEVIVIDDAQGRLITVRAVTSAK